MHIIDRLKLLFGIPELVKLDAQTQETIKESMAKLKRGQWGWITPAEKERVPQYEGVSGDAILQIDANLKGCSNPKEINERIYFEKLK